jgi:6-pyruvoyltetrahydropterin/6-carboxytetrahydropterin synthase
MVSFKILNRDRRGKKMSKQYKYTSTKNYNQIGPVAYRQWRASSHCNLIHGYAMSFKFEFSTDQLDVRNWAMDYGGLKPLKALLEEWFDHTLLVAEDDPMKAELERLGELKLAKIVYVEKTGCEGLADFLYNYVNDIFLPSYGTEEAARLWCTRVEVRETDNNMAYRAGDRPSE